MSPDERFSCSTLSRAAISRLLNRVTERLNIEPFAEDDKRLTKALCQHFAIRFGEDGLDYADVMTMGLEADEDDPVHDIAVLVLEEAGLLKH